MTVTVMSVATRGAIYRLLSLYVCSPSAPSTGAMVGSPLTPARLKAAFSGDSSTLCRAHSYDQQSAAAKQRACLGSKHRALMAVSQRQGVHCWCKEAHSAGNILLTLRFLLETAKFATLKPANPLTSTMFRHVVHMSCWTSIISEQAA